MGIWLAMATADGDERLYAVTKNRMVIGREARCDLRVPLRSVDSNHCEIVVRRNRLSVRDLGSERGTFVNGQRISEVRLRKRDSLQLGPVTFTIRNGKHATSNGAQRTMPQAQNMDSAPRVTPEPTVTTMPISNLLPPSAEAVPA